MKFDRLEADPELVVKFTQGELKLMFDYGIFQRLSRKQINELYGNKHSFRLNEEKLTEINSMLADELEHHDNKHYAFNLTEREHGKMQQLFRETETMIANLMSVRARVEDYTYNGDLEL